GMLALYAAALDTRISAAYVSCYCDDRRSIWQQPIDRNVFGLLDEFHDADLCSMVLPRFLLIEQIHGLPPELALSGQGGAPSRLTAPKPEAVDGVMEQVKRVAVQFRPEPFHLVSLGTDHPCSTALVTLRSELSSDTKLTRLRDSGELPQRLRNSFDSKPRQLRQIHE